MKTFLKIPVLVVMAVLLVAGSAMAIPIIEVEGHVSPLSAVYTENSDGVTASLEGLEYIFNVTYSEDGAGMNAFTLEFQDEAFVSVSNPYLYDPSTWSLLTTYTSLGSDSYYEVSVDSSGDKLEAGEQLSFMVDVVMNISALTDGSVWQEGQVWGQSWFALDTTTLQNFLQGIPIASDGGSTSPAPEPATMLLLGTGLAGLVAVTRRRKVRKA